MMMRHPSHAIYPAHLRRFLAWLCYQTLMLSSSADGHAGGMGACQSEEYITVGDATSFPIGGCYRRIGDQHHGDRGVVYTSTRGEIEGRTRQLVVAKESDAEPREESRWTIHEVLESASEDFTSGVICRQVDDSGIRASPVLVRRWECTSKEATFAVTDLVTCGCAASGEGGVETAPGSMGFRGVSSRMPGRGTLRGTATSRVLETVGEFNGFWLWIIIAGSIAGLIVLCCIGWYIRNPFFIQTTVPNPDIQVENAVPQAPKTAFQPWGASAPPK